MDEQMPEGSWYCAAGAAVGFIGVAVLTGGLGVGPFIGTYLALGGGAAGLFGGGALYSKIDEIKKRKLEKKNEVE